MVLGKVKYEDYMGVIDAVDRLNDIIVFSKGNIDNLLCMHFESEEACKIGFENICKDLALHDCCNLDKISKKTGMVMR